MSDNGSREVHVDGTTGEMLIEDPSRPRIDLCYISAVGYSGRGGGVDVQINPMIINDPVLLQAMVEDVRVILGRIEKKYLNKEGGAK